MKNVISILATLGLLMTTSAHAQMSKSDRKFTALDVFNLEYATDPQPSHDGSEIIYVRRSNDIMTDRTRSNIWSVKADGSENRPLLSGRDNYSSPRWSPDGKNLPIYPHQKEAHKYISVGMTVDKQHSLAT